MLSIPHRNSLLAVFLVAVFSTVALLLVVMRANPFSVSVWPQIAFFLSLFLSVASFLALAGYFVRLFLYRNEIFLSHLTIALRQGMLGALLLCVSLYFQHLRVLTWWNALLLACIVALLEVFFLSRED